MALTAFLRKHGRIDFEWMGDSSPESIRASEITLANNLVLLEPAQMQIEFLKYPISRPQRMSLYTHGEWLRLYKTYCAPEQRLSPDFVPLTRRAYLTLMPLIGPALSASKAEEKKIVPERLLALKKMQFRAKMGYNESGNFWRRMILAS